MSEESLFMTEADLRAEAKALKAKVERLAKERDEANKMAMQVQQSFKRFHQMLCERFGYGHDEEDWRRDLLSLEEHIAKRTKLFETTEAATELAGEVIRWIGRIDPQMGLKLVGRQYSFADVIKAAAAAERLKLEVLDAPKLEPTPEPGCRHIWINEGEKGVCTKCGESVPF